MKKQKPQIEELQALAESLELQRRQSLALILGLQDDGVEFEDMEQARLKLVLINQELAQCKAQTDNLKRRQFMAFETPEMMETMIRALKAVDPVLKEAVRVRDDAEVKVQVLIARKAKFEEQKEDLAAETSTLKEKISQMLGEGGDPSDLNRQVRAKGLEIEDLESWTGQLKDKAIPEAEKLLSEAQSAVWRALLKVTGEVKTTFADQMNEHLAQAATIAHSWQAVIRQFFNEHRTGKGPTETTFTLPIDVKKTFFGAVQLR